MINLAKNSVPIASGVITQVQNAAVVREHAQTWVILVAALDAQRLEKRVAPQIPAHALSGTLAVLA
jgi:hypothetical protein